MFTPVLILALLFAAIANIHPIFVFKHHDDLILAFNASDLVLIGIGLALISLTSFVHHCFLVDDVNRKKNQDALLKTAFEAQELRKGANIKTLNDLKHQEQLLKANADLELALRELGELKAETDRLRQNTTRTASDDLTARIDNSCDLQQTLYDAPKGIVDAQQNQSQDDTDNGVRKALHNDARLAVDEVHAQLQAQDAVVVCLKEELDTAHEEAKAVKEKLAHDLTDAKVTIHSLKAELFKQKSKNSQGKHDIEHGDLQASLSDARSATDEALKRLRAQDDCVLSLKEELDAAHKEVKVVKTELDAAHEKVSTVKEKSVHDLTEAMATIRSLQAEISKQRSAYTAVTARLDDSKAEHDRSAQALTEEKVRVKLVAKMQEDALRAELEARQIELQALKEERADLEVWLDEKTKPFGEKFRQGRIRSAKARMQWLFFAHADAQNNAPSTPVSPPFPKTPKAKTPIGSCLRLKPPNLGAIAADTSASPINLSLPLEASTPLTATTFKIQPKPMPTTKGLPELCVIAASASPLKISLPLEAPTPLTATILKAPSKLMPTPKKLSKLGALAANASASPIKISLPLEASTPLNATILKDRLKLAATPKKTLFSRLPLPTRRRGNG